jgi:hypothetical protein
VIKEQDWLDDGLAEAMNLATKAIETEFNRVLPGDSAKEDAARRLVLFEALMRELSSGCAGCRAKFIKMALGRLAKLRRRGGVSIFQKHVH